MPLIARSGLTLLLIHVCLLGATIKLYLKDGSYQVVREYQVEEDRIRFFSTDRGEWEEMPVSLVDLQKTQAEVQAREEEIRANSAANAAEDKAERDARKEVEQIPKDNGVYLIENEKLTPIKVAES